MEVRPFGGWERCAWLAGDGVEAVVTLEVGPRILRFGQPGGPNHLCVYDRHAGLTGGHEYRSYGGHRLWVAPEHPVYTYEADNEPVKVENQDKAYRFETSGPNEFGRHISLEFKGPVLAVCHAVSSPHELKVPVAAWGVTVMAPGGECFAPLPDVRSEPKELLPSTPVVLWRYTDLSDERLSLTNRAIRVRQRDGGPTKIGTFVERGWVMYANMGDIFMKTFAAEQRCEYPDFGCNFEVYTRHDMLEVESLSKLGSSVSHREHWCLFTGRSLPQDDDEAVALGDSLAAEMRSYLR